MTLPSLPMYPVNKYGSLYKVQCCQTKSQDARPRWVVKCLHDELPRWQIVITPRYLPRHSFPGLPRNISNCMDAAALWAREDARRYRRLAYLFKSKLNVDSIQRRHLSVSSSVEQELAVRAFYFRTGPPLLVARFVLFHDIDLLAFQDVLASRHKANLLSRIQCVAVNQESCHGERRISQDRNDIKC
jgi:hypothetical protein